MCKQIQCLFCFCFKSNYSNINIKFDYKERLPKVSTKTRHPSVILTLILAMLTASSIPMTCCPTIYTPAVHTTQFSCTHISPDDDDNDALQLLLLWAFGVEVAVIWRRRCCGFVNSVGFFRWDLFGRFLEEEAVALLLALLLVFILSMESESPIVKSINVSLLLFNLVVLPPLLQQLSCRAIWKS